MNFSAKYGRSIDRRVSRVRHDGQGREERGPSTTRSTTAAAVIFLPAGMVNFDKEITRDPWFLRRRQEAETR